VGIKRIEDASDNSDAVDRITPSTLRETSDSEIDIQRESLGEEAIPIRHYVFVEPGADFMEEIKRVAELEAGAGSTIASVHLRVEEALADEEESRMRTAAQVLEAEGFQARVSRYGFERGQKPMSELSLTMAWGEGTLEEQLGRTSPPPSEHEEL